MVSPNRGRPCHGLAAKRVDEGPLQAQGGYSPKSARILPDAGSRHSRAGGHPCIPACAGMTGLRLAAGLRLPQGSLRDTMPLRSAMRSICSVLAAPSFLRIAVW